MSDVLADELADIVGDHPRKFLALNATILCPAQRIRTVLGAFDKGRRGLLRLHGPIRIRRLLQTTSQK